MKLLAVIFLAGLALISAVPVPSQDLSLDSVEDLDFLINYALEADDDEGQEVKKKLREHLDELLEKIKDAIEHGKGVSDDYIKKFKELKEKLKEAKEEIGAKAKELLQKIKEKGQDYLKKILERLGLSKRSIDMHLESFSPENDDVTQKFKDRFEEVVKKLELDGKNMKEDLETLSDICRKLKDMNGSLGETGKQLIERFKDQGRNHMDKLLEKMRQKRSINIKDMLRKFRETELSDLLHQENVKQGRDLQDTA